MHLKLNILNKVKEVLKFNCSAVKQKINKMIGHLILVIKLQNPWGSQINKINKKRNEKKTYILGTHYKKYHGKIKQNNKLL